MAHIVLSSMSCFDGYDEFTIYISRDLLRSMTVEYLWTVGVDDSTLENGVIELVHKYRR